MIVVQPRTFSLITKFFKDFAFIANSNINNTYISFWLYLICVFFTTDHFFARKFIIFHFNSWLNFRRLRRLLREYQFYFVMSNHD